MVFLVLWVISPIVLIPFLIYFILEKRKKTKENDELKIKLNNANQEISHLQQRIQKLKELYSANTHQEATEPEIESAAEPVIKSVTESVAESVIKSVVEPVIEPAESESQPVTEENQKLSADFVESAYRGNDDLVEQKAVTKDEVKKKSLPSGTVLFGIGVLFVLIAGAIFATTTWQVLPAAGKVLTLLGAVSVFYISSYIAQQKLQLRETSIAFFFLGSSFLSVINLGVGYFKWFGDAYILEGQQAYLVWSVSVLILAICLFIGNNIYDVNLLGIIAYPAFLLSILLFARFITDIASTIVLVAGIYLILSWAYIYYRRYNGYKVSFVKVANILSYIYLISTVSSLIHETPFVIAIIIMLIGLIISFVISVLLTGDVKDIGILHIYSAAVAILFPLKWVIELSTIAEIPIFLIFALAYALIFKFVKLKDGSDLGNALSDVISGGLLLFSTFSILFSIENKGQSLFTLAVWILSFVIFTVFVLKLKNTNRVSARIMDFANADICLLGVTIAACALNSLNDVVVWLFIPLVLAIVLFVCFEIQENNAAGFAPVLTIFIVSSYLVNHFANDKDAVKMILNIVLFIIAITVGRLRYRQVSRLEGYNIKVDWLSVLSPVFAIVIYRLSESYILFAFFIVMAVYFANYYRREPEYVDRVMLSISAIMVGLSLYNWPFFEIKSSFSKEWSISIIVLLVVACGFIWNNIEKIYSKIASIVALIVFYSYMREITSELEYLSAGRTIPIAIAKIAFLLIGIIIIFAFGIWRDNIYFYIVSGALIAHTSILSRYLVAKWIIILPVVIGIGYTAYIWINKKKNLMIFPLLQVYFLMGGLKAPVFAYLIVFVVMNAYGYVSYRRVVTRDGSSLEIDWFTLLAFLPILNVALANNKNWQFCAGMMISAYILSFYNRITTNERINRGLLTLTSIAMGLTIISQPFFDVLDIIETEWFLFIFWAVIIFNIAYVYRNVKDTNRSQILYCFAIASIIWQGIDAVGSGSIVDSLILGISMVALLIFSFVFKKKMWFLLAAITLILQGIYTSRRFWLSIAWWVYLLAVGVILIAIAAVNEYRKRNDMENDHEQMNLFNDWNIW